MSKDNEYFKNTYVAYPLKFASNSGFVLADVVDMKAILTPVQSGCTSKTYTKSGGGIIEVNGVLTVEIQATDIGVEGDYDWRITMTNTLGKVVGMEIFPSRIIFK